MGIIGSVLGGWVFVEEDAENMLEDAKVKAAKAGSTLAGKVADKTAGLKDKLDIVK